MTTMTVYGKRHVGAEDRYAPYVPHGRKGGGKGGGGGSQRVAQEDPNTLRSRSTARVVDAIAQGEILGLVDGAKSIFLDDTPIQAEDGSFNFEGVSWDSRTGTPDQDFLKGFPAVESENLVVITVSNDTPVVRTLPSTDIDAVRVVARFGALLFQDTSNGDLKGTSVQLAIDLRENGGSWVQKKIDTVSGKTTSPYERAYRIELTPGTGPWEIRFRRVTADREQANYTDEFTFARFTEIVDAKFIYPNTALVGLAVDSEFFGGSVPRRAYEIYGKIVRVPANYDPDTRAYTGIWDGTFKLAWSDNPAWVLLDLMTASEYGLGRYIDTTQVDTAALYTIAQYCDELVDDGFGGEEPRFTFNGVIQTAEEAYRVVQTVSSVFRGMGFWSSGAVSFAADMPRDPDMIVTPANVLNGDFVYSGTGLKARHSVAIVSFNDPDDGYRLSPEVYEDADLINAMGWEPKQIQAPFCTSRGQAHRLGKWVIDSEKTEAQTVTYKASYDHAQVFPGQIIAIADPARAAVRFGGRIASATTTQVVLDDTVTLSGSETYEVTVELPNGTLEERTVTNGAGSFSTLSVDPAFSQSPLANAVWLLTGSDVAPTLWRVLANREEKKNIFEITAVYQDATKYARIESNITIDPANFSAFPTGPLSTPTEVTHSEYLYLAGPQVKGAVTVSFRAANDSRVVFYEKQVQRPGGNFKTTEITSDLSFDVQDIAPGQHSFRVRSVDALGATSKWVTITVTLFGTDNKPADVTGFTIDIIGDEAHLSWDANEDLDIAHYRIRFQGVTSGASWSTATDLVKKVAKPATSIVVPAMVGTYLIKAADQSIPAQESDNAALIVSNVAGLTALNVVETVDEHPTFAGVKQNCFVETDQLKMSSEDFISGWTTLTSVTTLTEGAGVGGLTATYYINDFIDLTEVYTSRVSVTVSAYGDNLAYPMSAWTSLAEVESLDGSGASDWGVILQLRTTEDDPNDSPAWSEWKTFTLGDYKARGFDFRVIMTSAKPEVQVVIEQLTFSIDMPDRVVSLNDQTCPAIGTTVNFSPAFKAVPAIAVSAQDMATGDYYTKTNITSDSFDLRFFNSGGSGVERTFDVLAKSYGRRA